MRNSRSSGLARLFFLGAGAYASLVGLYHFGVEQMSTESRQESYERLSDNWAGHAKLTEIDNPKPLFTAVRASWVVASPGPNDGKDSVVAEWIGIDGGAVWDSTKLIQVGTFCQAPDICRGFYQKLPEHRIDLLKVKPGQTINAEITERDSSKSLWRLRLEDDDLGTYGETDVTYSAPKYSVEWIVEVPYDDQRGIYLNVPHFGEVKFFNMSYEIDSAYRHAKVKNIDYNILQNGEVLTKSGMENSELVVRDLKRR